MNHAWSPPIRRFAAASLVAALAMLVSACLLAPGKFASTLDVGKDGRFAFTYKGELYFVSPNELSDDAGKKGSDDVFQPEPCKGANGAERECSSVELDRQLREWEERQKNSGEKKPSESQQMAAMMGGMDMSDPRTAEEFARNLERQAGWRSVTYKGKGLFEVDYAISGNLSHDFVFPVMQGFPMANPFVQITLRQDGSARVEAMGFSSDASGGPLKGLANLAAMDKSKNADKNAPQLPKMDGIFMIRTDGEILANNTDEGPEAVAGGSRLFWTVNERTERPPTALIRLSR